MWDHLWCWRVTISCPIYFKCFVIIYLTCMTITIQIHIKIDRSFITKISWQRYSQNFYSMHQSWDKGKKWLHVNPYSRSVDLDCQIRSLMICILLFADCVTDMTTYLSYKLSGLSLCHSPFILLWGNLIQNLPYM